MSTPLVGAPQLSPVTLELHERSTHLPRISGGTATAGSAPATDTLATAVADYPGATGRRASAWYWAARSRVS